MSSTAWSRRRFLTVAGLGGAAAALVGCGSGDKSTAGSTVPPASAWGGELVDPGLAKPDVTLATTDGKPFEFREATAGKLTLLFFGFTNCPDQCPIWLNAVARAKEQIGSGPGSDPQVLFVGVDVARDTPEVLDEYLGRIDSSFIGLTGTEAAIAVGQPAALLPAHHDRAAPTTTATTRSATTAAPPRSPPTTSPTASTVSTSARQSSPATSPSSPPAPTSSKSSSKEPPCTSDLSASA